MEEEKKKNIEQSVRDTLFSSDNELGLVIRKWPYRHYSTLGIMPKKIYELGKNHNIGFKGSLAVSPGKYDLVHAETYFRSYDECTKKEKKAIAKRKRALAAFRKKVNRENSTQYDKEGFITLPIYRQPSFIPDYSTRYDPISPIISGESSEREFVEVADSITIPITQRELAEVGLLPEDFGWQEITRAEITEADIAEADKEQELLPAEVGGIRGLIQKIKEFFKGKEEK